jgi:hypothetical protein
MKAVIAVLSALVGVAVASYSLGGKRPEISAVSFETPGVIVAGESRSAAIRRDGDAIHAECQVVDLATWQRNTATYRRSLKSKIDGLKTFPKPPGPSAACQYEALEGLADFPLFEVMAKDSLRHIYDPASLDAIRAAKPIQAARRWLGDRGIDLIVVTVPQMVELYPEYFVQPCPSDGILAPHVRQTLLELLEDDVEVVDGFRVLRSLRDTDPEPLSNTCDGHWAPRAMRIVARRVADRIERYDFGARGRHGLPVVVSSVGPFILNESPGGIGSKWTGWLALTPRQQSLARAAQVTQEVRVTMPDGTEPPNDPASPVVVIGSSFAHLFRGSLTRELNLLPLYHLSSQQTTEAFADFLREPELLANAKVVVWIITEAHMTHFAPMPGPIMEAAK